jgi:NAD(P)-dependent dehydrogenase (short-subunit alcohol dehydrogenase family)
LEAFCLFVEQTYDRLDVLINNACQTVRRPPAYYSHLVEREETFHHCHLEMKKEGTCGGSAAASFPLLLEEQNRFLSAYAAHQQAQYQRDQALLSDSASSLPRLTDEQTDTLPSSSSSLTSPTAPSSAPPLPLTSAQMSQVALLAEERTDHLNPSTLQRIFPLGHRDVNNQQVDLRQHNSWTMKLHEIPTVELAEVFAINAIAPTILNARLKPLMKRSAPLATAVMGDKDWKFIVNVSAMEGKFYRYKSSNHPHTNMAKAALNMMTRTSAQDYVKDRIFMTAVDTGWINDEKPIEMAMRHEEKHDFQTPLDEIDAASRVLDPVICPIKAIQDRLAGRGGEQGPEGGPGNASAVIEPPWGHFIKDYMKSEW